MKARGPRRKNEILAAKDLANVTRKLEGRLAAAFTEAVREMRSEVKLRALSRAIEAGNLAEALDIVGAEAIAARMRGRGLKPGVPSLVDRIVEAFREGGAAGMRQLPPRASLLATLDLTNPEAVRYLSENVPVLIREVTIETQQAVQSSLLRGFNEGRPAIQIAREVRGSVGLTEAQARAIGNFRRQLETGEMGIGQAPWDRRLSATERAQSRSIYRAGGERSARVDALVERYEQSLVNRRARNIARTEVTRAFGEGQDELWRQATEQELIDPTRTREGWLVAWDERLRKQHRAVPRMNPNGVSLGGMFDTPIGPVRGPRTSGVPAFDVNCRCTKYLMFD